MKEKYLVGLDGSECGRRAIAAAVHQAQVSGGGIVLSYVIPWSPFTFSTAEENALRHKRREEELARASEQLLQPEQKRLQQDDISCEVVARHGHPAKTLAHLAREYEVSMIVIGAIGDTPIKSRFLGGTASTLIQISPCPVLVVP